MFFFFPLVMGRTNTSTITAHMREDDEVMKRISLQKRMQYEFSLCCTFIIYDHNILPEWYQFYV